MSTPEEDQAALDAAAAAPLIVQIDNQNIQQQSLRDQILSADRKAHSGSSRNAWCGAFGARISPPGSVGPRPTE